MWTEQQYDEQIRELTAHPDRIFGQWAVGTGLFKHTDEHPKAGCLTTIRAGADNSGNRAYINGVYNETLTNQIHNDIRIPTQPEGIHISDLPVFKEWQMKIDKLKLLES